MRSGASSSGPLRAPSPASLAVLAKLAQSLRQRLDGIAGRTVEAICQRDDGYRTERFLTADELRRSVRDSLDEYLGALASLPLGVQPSKDQAWATGRSRAELGVPLESVLRAYRLGGSVIWEELLEEARSRPDRPTDDLMEAAVVVWQMTDELSSAVGTAYRHSEAGLVGRDVTRRQALLRGLLSGILAESDLIFAAESLGLPEEGPYQVAVIEPEPEERALREVLAQAGARSEWVSQEGRKCGLLAPPSSGAEVVKVCLGRMVPLRAGLSPLFANLSEAAAAYRQAELALRSIPAHRHAVAALDDRLGPALLVSSPELARRLAVMVMGSVLALPAQERRTMVRTLRIFLDGSGSPADTARQVPCHRNTVLNRLNRIRELTGCDPTTPRGANRLCLAMEAAELLSLLD
ncbi:MAG: PucR family transcriptional regulator [Candidatus Dormibacteria bacterium]